ncbi:MAG: MotA/TolQ/ExbB proton channel family protein [bacterium]|nr:MotA/TolQ/ExbB proton channel family protein [bacterium]
MDITVIIGIVAGTYFLLQAIGLESVLSLFFNPNAMIMVLGGTICASMVHFPWTNFSKIPELLFVIFSMKKHNYKKDITFITALSKKIKMQGKTSIKDDIQCISDHFLKTGLQLYVDNVDAEELDEILNENIGYMRERHYQGIQIFEQMAKYSPAFGLLGTVVGLIKLLAELQNPEAIGPGMALALVTTFYGLILANLVFTPLGGRLYVYSQEEQLQKEMLLVGIMAIAKEENSFIVEEKMMLFLTDKERKKKRKKTRKKADSNG